MEIKQSVEESQGKGLLDTIACVVLKDVRYRSACCNPLM